MCLCLLDNSHVQSSHCHCHLLIHAKVQAQVDNYPSTIQTPRKNMSWKLCIYTTACPSDILYESQKSQCVSVEESVWGTNLLEELESIKKEVDPHNMFKCYRCVGYENEGYVKEDSSSSFGLSSYASIVKVLGLWVTYSSQLCKHCFPGTRFLRPCLNMYIPGILCALKIIILQISKVTIEWDI